MPIFSATLCKKNICHPIQILHIPMYTCEILNQLIILYKSYFYSVNSLNNCLYSCFTYIIFFGWLIYFLCIYLIYYVFMCHYIRYIYELCYLGNCLNPSRWSLYYTHADPTYNMRDVQRIY